MAEPKERIVTSLTRARAELEEALYELEKLAAVSQSSLYFAAHALGNFLTITGGTVELLQSWLADHPDPRVHKSLEGLHQATDWMGHTVSQLVNASHDQEHTFRFEAIDLSLMVQRFCHYYQRAAARKGIAVVQEPSGEVPPAWTDRVAVAAVLDNLFSNAVKYSPRDTSIRVQVEAEEAGVVCRVRDEGPGLSEEDQARLFRRGVRLTPQPTGGEPVSGFGLAVAKEFLDRLGGTIWCESTPGQGCCFSFRLPRYDESLHGPQPSAPPPSPPSAS